MAAKQTNKQLTRVAGVTSSQPQNRPTNCTHTELTASCYERNFTRKRSEFKAIITNSLSALSYSVIKIYLKPHNII